MNWLLRPRVVLLVLVLLSVGAANPTFRALYLAALLIWFVMCNHKAEPNTFVIAVTGVAIWRAARTRLALCLATTLRAMARMSVQ